jgi:protein-arginine kinase activator protein McsA
MICDACNKNQYSKIKIVEIKDLKGNVEKKLQICEDCIYDLNFRGLND